MAQLGLRRPPTGGGQRLDRLPGPVELIPRVRVQEHLTVIPRDDHPVRGTRGQVVLKVPLLQRLGQLGCLRRAVQGLAQSPVIAHA